MSDADALGMFDAVESPPSRSSKDVSTSDRRVSLAELQSSRVPIEWYEALAIVQELCRTMLDVGDERAPSVLERAHVFIAASGAVSTTAPGARDRRTPVQGFGELLRTILPEDIFPVPLRLVVSQAVSTPPLYPSLKEFSQAIEYFERPNRTELIRGVYQRWTMMPAQSAATVPVAPRIEPRKSVESRRVRVLAR